MIRQARVVGIEHATGRVAVALDDTSECTRCQRGEGCGQGIAASLLTLNQARVTPQLSCLCDIELRDIEPGDNELSDNGLSDNGFSDNELSDSEACTQQQVLVDISDQGSAWLWPVFGAYGLPLAGMILATAVVSALSTPASAEFLHLIAAIGGLWAGIWVWRRISLRVLTSVERSLCLQSARIVGVVPSTNREPR